MDFVSEDLIQVRQGNLGNAKTARKRLEDNDIKISHWGNYVLDLMKFEENEATLDLVRVSAKSLGLVGGVTTKEIYDVAKYHNLSLCPAEIGPQLWLQHPNLIISHGEWTMVAMKPVVGVHKGCGLFGLAHSEGGHWLFGMYGSPKYRWINVNCYWIFVKN